MARIDQEYPCEEWLQAPYDIKKMRLDGAAGAIIRPVLSRWDDYDSPHSLAGHGLVSLLVAEAIIACLKTFIEAHPDLTTLAKYIEFRVRSCRLIFDWKVTKENMDLDAALVGPSPNDTTPEG